MARLEIIRATAPSCWASYLINGDDSGISRADRRAADQFRRWLGAQPCDCEDAGFCWHHDAHQFMPLGADCQLYTALVQEAA